LPAQEFERVVDSPALTDGEVDPKQGEGFEQPRVSQWAEFAKVTGARFVVGIRKTARSRRVLRA
jgi:hypothetical protein